LEQLDDSLVALDLVLTQAELAQLDEVNDLPPEYSGWAVELMGRTRRPVMGGSIPDLANRLGSVARPV